MTVADVPGVEISGLIFDAGADNSPALLQFGDPHRDGHEHGTTSQRPTDPARSRTCSSASAGRTSARRPTSLVVGQRQRDPRRHLGVARRPRQRRRLDEQHRRHRRRRQRRQRRPRPASSSSTTRSYDVFWTGENGKTIMFQNEMPYDPPNQAAWQHDGVLGWAAYKVADSVQDPRGLGPRQLLLLQRRPDDPRDATRSRCRSRRA